VFALAQLYDVQVPAERLYQHIDNMELYVSNPHGAVIDPSSPFL